MSSRTRRARLLGVAGATLLIAGAIAIVIAVRAQQSAPQPPPSAARPVNVIPRSASNPDVSRTSPSLTKTPHNGPPRSTTQGPVLARSIPLHLRIPAIGVDDQLKQIGLNNRGQIITPPLVKDSHAYWLNVSPTPGQLGPSTIIGHVDSAAYGPAVFFKLGDLRQRDKIYITRADGRLATFEIDRVVEYKKAHFPTQQVYGNINHAGLRLITCGGTFDSATGNYESDIVVYAALVSVHAS